MSSGSVLDNFGDQNTQRDPTRPSRPGDALATRPLHFIWLVDCSGSMALDGKIQAVNTAIKEAIPLMRQVADDNPNARIMIRALKFSSGAQWHVAEPTPVDEFRWSDVEAQGTTDLGAAFLKITEQLKMPPMEERALPPVLVLLSDGEPTDDYGRGLEALFAEPWGTKAVRIAIAIGRDAKTSVLQSFINHPELTPLQANSPESLVRYIKWCSTEVVRSVSSPASVQVDTGTTMSNLPVPAPAAADAASEPLNEVW